MGSTPHATDPKLLMASVRTEGGMKMRSLPNWILIATLLLLRHVPSVLAQTNTPARERIEKTVVVNGSQMTNDKWRSTNVELKTGDKVTISVVPMGGLNKSQEFRHDALVFRVGPTGDEFLTDSNGRATWYLRKKKRWRAEPTRTFSANMDGDLYYSTRQDKKFTCKIVVER